MTRHNYNGDYKVEKPKPWHREIAPIQPTHEADALKDMSFESADQARTNPLYIPDFHARDLATGAFRLSSRDRAVNKEKFWRIEEVDEFYDNNAEAPWQHMDAKADAEGRRQERMEPRHPKDEEQKDFSTPAEWEPKVAPAGYDEDVEKTLDFSYVRKDIQRLVQHIHLTYPLALPHLKCLADYESGTRLTPEQRDAVLQLIWIPSVLARSVPAMRPGRAGEGVEPATIAPAAFASHYYRRPDDVSRWNDQHPGRASYGPAVGTKYKKFMQGLIGDPSSDPSIHTRALIDDHPNAAVSHLKSPRAIWNSFRNFLFYEHKHAKKLPAWRVTRFDHEGFVRLWRGAPSSFANLPFAEDYVKLFIQGWGVFNEVDAPKTKYGYAPLWGETAGDWQKKTHGAGEAYLWESNNGKDVHDALYQVLTLGNELFMHEYAGFLKPSFDENGKPYEDRSLPIEGSVIKGENHRAMVKTAGGFTDYRELGSLEGKRAHFYDEQLELVAQFFASVAKRYKMTPDMPDEELVKITVRMERAAEVNLGNLLLDLIEKHEALAKEAQQNKTGRAERFPDDPAAVIFPYDNLDIEHAHRVMMRLRAMKEAQERDGETYLWDEEARYLERLEEIIKPLAKERGVYVEPEEGAPYYNPKAYVDPYNRMLLCTDTELPDHKAWVNKGGFQQVMPYANEENRSMVDKIVKAQGGARASGLLHNKGPGGETTVAITNPVSLHFMNQSYMQRPRSMQKGCAFYTTKLTEERLSREQQDKMREKFRIDESDGPTFDMHP